MGTDVPLPGTPDAFHKSALPIKEEPPQDTTSMPSAATPQETIPDDQQVSTEVEATTEIKTEADPTPALTEEARPADAEIQNTPAPAILETPTEVQPAPETQEATTAEETSQVAVAK